MMLGGEGDDNDVVILLVVVVANNNTIVVVVVATAGDYDNAGIVVVVAAVWNSALLCVLSFAICIKFLFLVWLSGRTQTLLPSVSVRPSVQLVKAKFLFTAEL